MSLGNKEIMANNIRRLLEQKGLNPRQMALQLDFKYTTVLDWVNAKTYPRIDKIELMANFFNVSKSDLVEEYRAQSQPTPGSAMANFDPGKAILLHNYSQLDKSSRNSLLETSEALLAKQSQTTVEEPQPLYDVRAVSRLAAGFGYGYDDHDTKTVYVEDEPPRHDVASLVEGDSMTPDYEHGNVVYLVDRGFSRFSGQVCAVVVDDETFIKKVYTEPNGLRLVSINPAYPDRFIDFPPSGDTHIKIFSVVGSAQIVEN